MDGLAAATLLSAFPDGHIPGVSMILLVLVMLVLGAVASWPFGSAEYPSSLRLFCKHTEPSAHE